MNINFGEYPESAQSRVTDDYFGTEVSDPYRWMEMDTSAEVKDWVRRQNEFTENYLSQIPFRGQLQERLTQMYNYTKYSAPFKRGELLFYSKNNGLQNQSVLYVKKNNAEAEVFLDPNKLSEDGTLALGGLSFSNDEKFVSYALSAIGSDWKTLKIKNVETGKDLEEEIQRLKFGGAAWSGNGFYYTAYEAPESGMEFTAATVSPKLYYHRLGTKQEEDQIIYENSDDEKRYFWPSTSRDEKYLFVSESKGTHGNQIHYRETKDSLGPLKPLFVGFEYDYNIVAVVDDLAYVKTNAEADNFKIITVPLKGKNEGERVDLIPSTELVLVGASMVNQKLFIHYLKDAASHIVEHGLNGEQEAIIELPGIGQINGFSAKRDEKELYYTFTSFINPSTVYKYNTETRKSEQYFDLEFPVDLSIFESKRIWCKSEDGTPIPIVITHKKGIKQDGANPTLLYGYGGFNISIRPGFKAHRMVFLENGGILAVANLRGGGEYGEEWHRAGMLEKKQNVFDDFIAAAEFLISEKYTNSGKLAIEGRSNGGLLIGACMLQRPDLFKVALPTVGVMDMLRYHKFTVGWGWTVEYGSSDEKEQFDYLIKYSPVHNVKASEYPATLVITGDHDDRVVPAHSYKFIASLQQFQTGTSPVMIRVEEDAGHGAGKPLSKRVEENADIWSFVMHHLGMNLEK
jgi:prolyl oligopeptidase